MLDLILIACVFYLFSWFLLALWGLHRRNIAHSNREQQPPNDELREDELNQGRQCELQIWDEIEEENRDQANDSNFLKELQEQQKKDQIIQRQSMNKREGRINANTSTLNIAEIDWKCSQIEINPEIDPKKIVPQQRSRKQSESNEKLPESLDGDEKGSEESEVQLIEQIQKMTGSLKKKNNHLMGSKEKINDSSSLKLQEFNSEKQSVSFEKEKSILLSGSKKRLQQQKLILNQIKRLFHRIINDEVFKELKNEEELAQIICSNYFLLKERSEKYLRENAKLQNQIDELKQKHNQEEIKVWDEEHQIIIFQLQEKIHALSMENEDLKQRQGKEDSQSNIKQNDRHQIENIKKNYNVLKRLNDDLRRSLDQQAKELEKQIGQIEEAFRQKIETLGQEKEKICNRQKQLQTENESLKAELEFVEKEKQEVMNRQKVELSKHERAWSENIKQVEELEKMNQQIMAELQFCKFSLQQASQTENALREQLFQLQKSKNIAHAIEISQLKAQIAKMKHAVQKDTTKKHEKDSHDLIRRQMSSGHERMMSENRSKCPSQFSQSKTVRGKSVVDERTSTINSFHGFLFNCPFIKTSDRQFIYSVIHKKEGGVFNTEKLYSSNKDSGNPHRYIDGKKKILLLIYLEGEKVIGAYSDVGFTAHAVGSVHDKDALLLDVTRKKSFKNSSGKNSIENHPSKIVWGYNQILINVSEPDVLYSNFGRAHNVYWDNKYSSTQLMGSEKQWARMIQFQFFRIMKIY